MFGDNQSLTFIGGRDIYSIDARGGERLGGFFSAVLGAEAVKE
jgi:hypothetical protein